MAEPDDEADKRKSAGADISPPTNAPTHNRPVDWRKDNEAVVRMNAEKQIDADREAYWKKSKETILENAKALKRQADEMSKSGMSIEEAAPKDALQQLKDNYPYETARFNKALAETDKKPNPFETHGNASLDERDLLNDELKRYDDRIKNETDTSKRSYLELEKKFRAENHIAFTSARIKQEAEKLYGSYGDETLKHKEREEEHAGNAKEVRRKLNRHFDKGWTEEKAAKSLAEYQRSEQTAKREHAEHLALYHPKQAEPAITGEVTDQMIDRPYSKENLLKDEAAAAREITARSAPRPPGGGHGR